MSNAASILFLILIVGCRSSRPEAKNGASSPDSAQHRVISKTVPPTSIAQNVSEIEAVVEKIEGIDETQFNVGIYVISSTPVGGRLSIVEAGQRMIVTSEFARGPAGNIDMMNETNKRLMTIRSKEIGQSFKGKITLNRYGSWNLIDVE